MLLCNAFSFIAVDFLGKIARRAGVWLGPPTVADALTNMTYGPCHSLVYCRGTYRWSKTDCIVLQKNFRTQTY